MGVDKISQLRPIFTISAKFHNPRILGIPGVRAVSQFLRCLFSVFRIVSPGIWSWTSWDTWSYLVPVKISPPCCLSWTHRCVIFIWYHAWIWKYRNPNENTKIISWAINKGRRIFEGTVPRDLGGGKERRRQLVSGTRRSRWATTLRLLISANTWVTLLFLPWKCPL